MKILDLFSGIGGFSLGLEKAGMKTVAFCEIDQTCRQVLKKHWPETAIYKDIRELSYLNGKIFHVPMSLDSAYGLRTHIDIICGGFPCQDVSVAGRKKGLKNDNGEPTRSGLWFEYKRLIKEIAPKYVIIENVANLRNEGLITVLRDLNEIGYDSEWAIIPASRIGLPHLRERIWIVAYPNSQRRHVMEDTSKGRNLFRYLNGNVETQKKDRQSKLELWARQNGKVHRRLTTSFWESESGILGMVDGLSKELVDANDERIKQLGNTIVPGIAELIGRAIMEDEVLS
jgi:DNA (cytosine-5)-methyltransferase 1